MLNQPIKIVGVVVTATIVTLYREDGSSFFLHQGDSFMRHVADDVIPAIKAQGYGMYCPTEIQRNPYAEYEQQSSIVKFFSVAKKKLTAFFNTQQEVKQPVVTTIEPCEIGVITPDETIAATPTGAVLGIIPKLDTDEVTSVKQTEVEETVTMDDLMASAVSVNNAGEFDSAAFVEPIDLNAASQEINTYEKKREKNENVLIAKVGNVVIPEADRLLAQVAHSVDKGSTQGMDNFIRRLSAIIGERQHTVEDVLRFIQRADLGISDNGDVIVYKALNTSSHIHGDLVNDSTARAIFKDGTIYVDSHSSRVNQRVGMLVTVPNDYVNTSRYDECAQGLHVARRAYLPSFKCDACVICAVRPEDFIAVPHADYNKVRVSAYHILAELSKEEYNLLLNRQSITKIASGQAKLDLAMRNAYPEPTCKVVITKPKGTGLVYSWLAHTKKAPIEKPVLESIICAPASIPAIEDSLDTMAIGTAPAEVVNPQDLGNSPVKEEVPATDPKPKVTAKATKKPVKPKEPAQPPKATSAKGSAIKDILAGKTPATLTDSDKEALRAIKRKQKKSWKALGVPENFQAVL